MVVEEWDESFSTLDPYRGVNANMHSVEALLSAADVLDDTGLRDRALRILTRVVHDLAASNQWRIPEHFDESWTPVLDYNVDAPAHPFRPVRRHHRALAGVGAAGAAPAGRPRRRAPDWLLDDAVPCSTPRSARAGRSTAPTGSSTPSTGPASRSYASGCTGSRPRPPRRPPPCTPRPGTRRTPSGTSTWWQHVATSSATPSTAHGTTSSRRRTSRAAHLEGKPDTYHAFQATLIPRLPLSPMLARALADGLLASTVTPRYRRWSSSERSGAIRRRPRAVTRGVPQPPLVEERAPASVSKPRIGLPGDEVEGVVAVRCGRPSVPDVVFRCRVASLDRCGCRFETRTRHVHPQSSHTAIETVSPAA